MNEKELMIFENQITNVDELPLTLTVEELAYVLRLSKQNTYELCHRQGFPCMTVGKRMIIPKLALIEWMKNPFKFESEVKDNGEKK